MMGLGDVSDSVIPKPVLVSAGRLARQHHLALLHPAPMPCLACGDGRDRRRQRVRAARDGGERHRARAPGSHSLVVLHPAGQIDVEVELKGEGEDADGASAPRWCAPRARSCRASCICPTTCSRGPKRRTRQPSAFPHKPLTIIVPTRAGGGNDTMARIIAARLGPAARPARCWSTTAPAPTAPSPASTSPRAEPDGHTLLFGYIGTHAMNPALQKLGYDPVGDFEPVGLVGSSPTLMVAHPRAGRRRTWPALVAQPAGQRRGRYGYASAGDGTPPHFAAELFQLSTGTSMSSATHDGAAPAIADTIDGRSQVMFPSLFTAYPFLRAGQLRALAVAGPTAPGGAARCADARGSGRRAASEVAQWYGLFAPAGTPRR